MQRVKGLAFVAIIAAASPAWADNRSEADRLFEEGKALYQANRFHDAIALFEKAFALVSDQVYLFNIAQAYRNAADCLKAHEYYVRYMTESPDPVNVDNVRGWVRELEPCATARKHEQEQARRAQELEKQLRDKPAAPVVAVAPRDTTDPGAQFRFGGLLLAGSSSIGFVIGIVYGVKSQSYENEIRLACSTACHWDDLEERDAAGRRANMISLVGYISGAVIAGAGVGLYLYGRSQTVVVEPTSGGAQVTARVRF